jgi:two-component system heavy metal sensor histidine kinase CusS
VSRGPWLLAGRITWRVALTTSLLVASLSVLGLLSLRASVEAQIEALTHEELDEMRVAFQASGEDLAELDAIAQELRDLHPENPMAFSVRRTADRSTLAELGDVRLLRDVDLLAGPGYRKYAGDLRGRTAALSDDVQVTIVLDGGAQFELLRRFFVGAMILIALSVVFSIAVAAVLGRQIARMLRRAAIAVRSSGRAGAGAGLGGQDDLPEEVRDVVEALRETLLSIELEAERARLMTSGLAHELRSPIQNLLGEAEVALLRERTPGDYRNVLESQIEELRDLARAVDNLVTLCAAGETRRSGDAEPFDLAEDIRSRLAREQSIAERREVDLRVDAPEPLEIEGDREALVLAVRNLVTNALDWAGKRGTVTVSAHRDGDRVRVRVEDSGPGVAPGDHERIFQPFARGTPRNGNRAAFGLGLALTRTAVENQGGTIAVSDSALGGACFTALLPKRPPRAVRSAQRVDVERELG